jgi:hypothetical protein
MTKEIFLLLIINTLSAVGYSLIAPIYPIIAHERCLKEHMIGIIISIFTISNFSSTPIVPKYISKYGKTICFTLQ